MKEGLYFSYDGIYSKDMGLINVNIDGGIYTESFLASREVDEMQIKGRDKPYFQGIIREPLLLELSFAFEDGYDEYRAEEVANWLCQDYYKPFYTTDNVNRIYYCMYVDEPQLIHNGAKQGYITITMKCDSPYSYSPTYVSNKYDFSNNTASGTIIEFDNLKSRPIYPEISLEKIGDGDISITNLTNNNENFEFIDLVNIEDLYIDGENQHIESNLPGVYRYDNFNDNYLKIIRGKNRLLIKGRCKLQFRYRFIMLGG